MVKKVTKKKNRRLRRQIRKTVGCLLMASAVFVAALPVPEISARNDQKVERVAVVNHTSSTDLTQFGTIDGREAPLEWRSNVPLVGDNEYIYTTADSSLQFAYINYNGEWIAVILGRKINSLPGGSFTIPAQVDGYRTYDVNMTNGGLCAVGQDGNFLYYRIPAKYRYTDKNGDHDVLDTDINLDLSGTSPVYRFFDAETQQQVEYAAHMIEPEQFFPCYQRDLAVWGDIADEDLYFQSGTTKAAIFSLPMNTATPSPTESPSATPAETPTPTAEGTSTPDVMQTLSPTPSESAEATPSQTPESTPSEVPTATPAQSPVETPSDLPTATPEETPTPNATPATTPTDEPSSDEGGDDLTSNGFTSLLPPRATETPTQTPTPTASPEADNGITTGKSDTTYYNVERVVVSNDNLIMAANNRARNLTGGIIQRGSGGTVPTYTRVGDAGNQKNAHMRIHNAAVRYIGRQYLEEHPDTGTWTIEGVVDSSHPELGVFAGLGQLVHLVTEADPTTKLSNLVGIGDYAFYGCTSLQSVDLANGINTIGNGAFEQCLNMTSFTIPRASNLMAFGKDAFSGCRKLKSIVIPTNVRAIGDYCFQDCVALETIEMGGDGTEVALNVIGWRAFENCSSLSSITFPGTFTQTYPTGWDIKAKEDNKIPITWFDGCNSLQYIKIQNSELDIVDDDEMNMEGPDNSEDSHVKKLLNDPNAEDDILDFLDKVPELFYFEGPGADARICNTARVHSAAFKYMSQDKYEKVMWCEAHNGDHKAIFAVDSNNQLVEMTLEKECGIVDIPAQIGARHIDTIGEFSFDRSKCFLKKITIPSTVQVIEQNAFKGCHNLEDVIFDQRGGNGPQIGANAFDTQDAQLHSSDCADKGSTFHALTFTGTISPASTPFLYAMDANNNYNNGSQQESFITFYSGWPSNLTVLYNKETDKNELINYPKIDDLLNYAVKSYGGGTAPAPSPSSPTTKGVGDPDAAATPPAVTPGGSKLYYPYLTADNVEAANSGAHKFLTSGGLTGEETVAVNGALNVNLPAGIESIKPGLFSGVDSENESVVEGEDPKPNTYIQSITMNTVEEVEPYTFSGCENLAGFYMAGGNKLGDYALKNCEKLAVAEIGASIAELGIRPFAGCTGLTNVNFIENPNFTCDNRIIYGTKDGAKKTLIECLETRDERVKADELTGVESMYPEAFMNCKDVDSVDFSESSVAIIPERAFANSRVHDVILSSATTNVLEGAFWNCDDLKYLTINNPITILDNNIFDKAELDGNDIKLDADGKPILTVRDKKLTLVVPEGSVAENYANGKPFIGLEVSIPVEYWITPPDGSGRPFKAYDRTTTRTKFEDPEAWEEERENIEPDKVDKDHPYPGWQFEKWGEYTESSGSGIKTLQTYAEYTQLAGEKFRVTFVDERQPDVTKRMWFVDKNPGESLTFSDIRDPYDTVNFLRWESDNGTAFSDPINANVTFYAVYRNSGGTDPTPSGNPNPSGSPGGSPNPSGSPGASITPSASPSGGNNNDKDDKDDKPTATPTATPTPSNGNDVVKYTVSVSGGSGSGQYAAGTVVAINAYYRGEGQLFDRWTTSTAGVGFANPESPSTTFTMPAANVAITATYKTGGAGTAATTTSGGGNGGNTVTGSTSNNNGTTVDITRPGISNRNLAGATVSGATDNFVVKVTEDQAATDAATSALQARFGDLSRIKYFPMDISLYDSTGRTKIADTSGISVNLTLPLPDELVQYAGNNKIAAISGGALEDLNARFTTIDGVPCINFTATHFSPYVIYVDTANLTEAAIDATPKTGDPIHPKWFLALGMACLSLILFFKRDRVVINTKTA